MDIKKSLIWTGFLRFFTRGLTIIKTLVLARILTPSQFGIFGVAALVLGLLETLTETGVNVVLIQEKKDIKHYLSTGWVVSILRGFLISSIIFLLAPLITNFFHSPESIHSLLVISLIPIIRGFINPAVVNYQKKLEFNNEFRFRGSLILIEVVFTVIFGLIIRNETAFVLGMIVSSLLEVCLSFVLIKDKPSIEFNIEKLKYVFAKGKWITGAKIFEYLFSHGDDIVVGKILGIYPLGLYQQAYKISSLSITEVAETFQKVTFPLYSKMINNGESVKKIYLKTLLATSLIIIPVGVAILLFPEQIILIIFGKNWLEAVNVLRVLAIFGIIKTIANSSFPLLLAFKRQDLVLYLTLIGILGLGISIYPLINIYGLIGAGLSTIIGSLVMLPPAFCWIRQILQKKNIND